MVKDFMQNILINVKEGVITLMNPLQTLGFIPHIGPSFLLNSSSIHGTLGYIDP